jgi:hypothetical protein
LVRARRRNSAPTPKQVSTITGPSSLLLARSRSRDASPALEHEHKSAAGQRRPAALRQEQAPAPVSVSWLRVVRQTHRLLAHNGIPAIELTIWRSRWPGCSPRRSSSCGGRGTIPSDGIQSPEQLEAGDRIGDEAQVRSRAVLAAHLLVSKRPQAWKAEDSIASGICDARERPRNCRSELIALPLCPAHPTVWRSRQPPDRVSGRLLAAARRRGVSRSIETTSTSSSMRSTPRIRTRHSTASAPW